MNQIEMYFKKKTENITFIELKENALIHISGYPKNKLIPLPIMTESLISEIKKGSLEEQINLSYFIDGMIYLLGVDSEFIHREDYERILRAYDRPVEDYIFYTALKALEEEKLDLSAIYFRALMKINPDNLNGKFNYALSLEAIAQSKINEGKEEEGLIFLKQATEELEKILDFDDKYPLAYYKLGFHYKFLGYFLKAKLIWSKYLRLDKDELRLQEIRGELDNIEIDALFETGITYLYREEYENSLDVFIKLLPKMDSWWELNYLIGLSYKGLGDYESSADYLEKALELNKEEADIYNELGICLYSLGEVYKAIETLTEGIKNIEDDYKMFFNRGLFYLEIGKIKEAYLDIEEATKLNPEDENIVRQMESLKEIFN